MVNVEQENKLSITYPYYVLQASIVRNVFPHFLFTFPVTRITIYKLETAVYHSNGVKLTQKWR